MTGFVMIWLSMTILNPGEREVYSSRGTSRLSGTEVMERSSLFQSTTRPGFSEPNENDTVVMLDPSLFLGEGGFEWFVDTSIEERANFVISRTFFEQVAGRVEYTDTDSQLWGQLPEESNRSRLEELLTGLTLFSRGDVVGDLPPEVLAIAERLREMGSRVAVEEWLYLNSNSWIAARTRNILDHFNRAGSKSIELLGNALDDATWLGLGQRPDRNSPLSPSLRRRAGANVLIAGGVGTLTFILPWFSIPGAILMLFYAPFARPRVNPQLNS